MQLKSFNCTTFFSKIVEPQSANLIACLSGRTQDWLVCNHFSIFSENLWVCNFLRICFMISSKSHRRKLNISMFYEIPNRNKSRPKLTETEDNHKYAYIYVDLYTEVERRPLVLKKVFTFLAGRCTREEVILKVLWVFQYIWLFWALTWSSFLFAVHCCLHSHLQHLLKSHESAMRKNFRMAKVVVNKQKHTSERE